MDEDEELAAIRAKLRQDIMQQATAPPPVAAPAAAGGGVAELGESEFEAFVRGHENAVVDLWAPWCGPCRIVGPIVEELSHEMAGRVRFAKVNVDMAPGISQAFSIQSIPTILVFRRQQLVERIVGAYPKPQLAQLLERHFGGRRASGSAGPRRV